MTNQDLHIKYRPSSLSEVVGHGEVKESLRALQDSKKVPHAFLFCGPTGSGKTTLARIVARDLMHAPDINILEVDAATYSKVESTRELVKSLGYVPLGGGGRVVIVDECHALSSQSWQALLKVVEEPKGSNGFIFCTTEVEKVPATIRSRCHTYVLGSISRSDLVDLLEAVAKKERFGWASEEVLAAVAAESSGSPRQALVNLSMCRGAETASDVRAVLATMEEGQGDELIAICRLLLREPTDGRNVWKQCVQKLEVADIDNPESARLAMMAYFTKVLLSKPMENTLWRLHVIDCLSSRAYNFNERKAGLLLALGRILLEG